MTMDTTRLTTFTFITNTAFALPDPRSYLTNTASSKCDYKLIPDLNDTAYTTNFNAPRTSFTPNAGKSKVEIHWRVHEVVLGVQGNEVTDLPFALKYTFQTVTGDSKAPGFVTDLTLQTFNVGGISAST
jgi:hypothetical protein